MIYLKATPQKVMIFKLSAYFCLSNKSGSRFFIFLNNKILIKIKYCEDFLNQEKEQNQNDQDKNDPVDKL